MPDSEVLELAANEGRVLVSGDVTTMPLHFAEFIAARPSPGVILVPPRVTVGETIERLLTAWLSWGAEDLENQMWWLSR